MIFSKYCGFFRTCFQVILSQIQPYALSSASQLSLHIRLQSLTLAYSYLNQCAYPESIIIKPTRYKTTLKTIVGSVWSFVHQMNCVSNMLFFWCKKNQALPRDK